MTVLVRASVVVACCGRVLLLSVSADEEPDGLLREITADDPIAAELFHAIDLHARSCPER